MNKSRGNKRKLCPSWLSNDAYFTQIITAAGNGTSTKNIMPVTIRNMGIVWPAGQLSIFFTPENEKGYIKNAVDIAFDEVETKLT